jgi:hypothetical protein
VLVRALRRVIALCVAGALLRIFVAAARAPLGSLLFGVETADPLTFGGVAARLLVVAVAAAWLPARAGPPAPAPRGTRPP